MSTLDKTQLQFCDNKKIVENVHEYKNTWWLKNNDLKHFQLIFPYLY